LKKISIIVNGPGIEEVKSLYGQASDWVQNVLSKYDIDLKVVKAYEMEEISVDLDDAWIITGSAHSVYDDFEWIDYLRIKLRQMKEANKPVLGICFGHQLIADTFGGKVELNSKGWELGSCQVELTDEAMNNKLFSGLPNPLDVYQSHQDVVLAIPEDSILMAKNSMGIQSFVYDEQFYGVQFHPEFTKTVMETYLDIRYKKGIIDNKPEVGESKDSYKILNNFIEKIVK
tara:strand:+ start:491 stop:1180 length:690 start_codon:yes stop_codon:yes gene_type:complete